MQHIQVKEPMTLFCSLACCRKKKTPAERMLPCEYR
jgi:hypothetical protein